MVLTLVVVTDERGHARRGRGAAEAAHASTRAGSSPSSRARRRPSRGSTPRCASALRPAPARRVALRLYGAARPTTPTPSCCHCCCRTRRWSPGGRATPPATRRTPARPRSPSAGSPMPRPSAAPARARCSDCAHAPTRPATRTSRGPGSRRGARCSRRRSTSRSTTVRVRRRRGAARQPERRAARRLAGRPARRPRRRAREPRPRHHRPSGCDRRTATSRSPAPTASARRCRAPGSPTARVALKRRTDLRPARGGAAPARPRRDLRRARCQALDRGRRTRQGR